MFTGIVEELGIVKNIVKDAESAKLSVLSKICYVSANIGDSISVNGSCFTVTSKNNDILTFDVSSETLKRTNIGNIKSNDRVNLESSLRPDSKMGGHFVTGHIDCTGKIISKVSKGGFVNIEIEIPVSFMIYLVEKGSICIDGISLTVNAVSSNSFKMSIIPHTLSITTLGHRRAGDSINIEVDILAKYVQRLLNKSSNKPADHSSKVTTNFLSEHGFM